MLARSLIRFTNRMLSTRGRTPEMHTMCLHVYVSSQSGSRIKGTNPPREDQGHRNLQWLVWPGRVRGATGH